MENLASAMRAFLKRSTEISYAHSLFPKGTVLELILEAPSSTETQEQARPESLVSSLMKLVSGKA